jgi:hypothetical protein
MDVVESMRIRAKLTKDELDLDFRLFSPNCFDHNLFTFLTSMKSDEKHIVVLSRTMFDKVEGTLADVGRGTDKKLNVILL